MKTKITVIENPLEMISFIGGMQRVEDRFYQFFELLENLSEGEDILFTLDADRAAALKDKILDIKDEMDALKIYQVQKEFRRAIESLKFSLKYATLRENPFSETIAKDCKLLIPRYSKYAKLINQTTKGNENE